MKLHIGKPPLAAQRKTAAGGYMDMDGERFYRIADYDGMPLFLMAVVSASDHWMFVSSGGGLTAGRKDPDNALFPYDTDDRIHEGGEHTGGKTILRVTRGDSDFLWEPFSGRYRGAYAVRRNLYKNIPGNKLIFEEVNLDLGLTFRAAWIPGERFGFIRRTTLINDSERTVRIDLMDGIQNILPWGITRRFQMEYSTLADGYKKNELDPGTGLGIFRLSSVPTDKAEPNEALRVTTVWSEGVETAVHLLSSRQLDRFRDGESLTEERDVRGTRGAYFLNARFDLDGGEHKVWHIVAEVGQDASDAAGLKRMLASGTALREQIDEDVSRSTENLVRIVSEADGLQSGGDPLSDHRHFNDVLFNVMRGGIFDRDYRIDRSDLLRFIRGADAALFGRHEEFLLSLPEEIRHPELSARIQDRADPGLESVCLEYLPLTFGRRHGDPSRPWNSFSIDIKDAHGNKVLAYQGNWRDLFQNWEALALSFPGYLESMIAKFLNASTADGYNPYRVTRDGYEWETLDPDDAWSYIGYWGDHQIVYLLRLMELSDRFHPGAFRSFLDRDVFSYAHVPYRIRGYDDLWKDPRNTLDFDAGLHAHIEARVQRTGSRGKCLPGADDAPVLVNLTEKLLVPVLAKLSNFIPEAGIWMNTQRPEWNDANNALVGYGVSVVTLCYLRRFTAFLEALFEGIPETGFPVSEEVAAWFDGIFSAFDRFAGLLEGPISRTDRKSLLDALGEAGGRYRQSLYRRGLSGKRRCLPADSLGAFCRLTRRFLDHAIRANRREDGLYHAYNLMQADGEGIGIRRLAEMLEGQVAVLSAGILTPRESLGLLDTLRRSTLYRADQESYLLYPDRTLPQFLERNRIPSVAVDASPLLSRLLAEGDSQVVVRDADGEVHFNADLRNARLLNERLGSMAGGPYEALIREEKESLLSLYETVFDHRSFTGRSGTFFKYEGLGCIYWHMVSKLRLAVQEVFFHACEKKAAPETRRGLRRHYEEIREGIGVHKPPDRYGAFPTDPYSHTPGFAGVQQPGMTGQVKEDILSRFGELGLHIRDGRIGFRPDLLHPDAFLREPGTFVFYDVRGRRQTLPLEACTLAFTYCRIPVVIHRTGRPEIRVTTVREAQVHPGLMLDAQTSDLIFRRSGDVVRLDVFYPGESSEDPEF
ncbi:MAG TPA: hypothetical protein ENN17_01395 [bacterium]|nr:hypothetical protein [bacterium]